MRGWSFLQCGVAVYAPAACAGGIASSAGTGGTAEGGAPSPGVFVERVADGVSAAAGEFVPRVRVVEWHGAAFFRHRGFSGESGGELSDGKLDADCFAPGWLYGCEFSEGRAAFVCGGAAGRCG